MHSVIDNSEPFLSTLPHTCSTITTIANGPCCGRSSRRRNSSSGSSDSGSISSAAGPTKRRKRNTEEDVCAICLSWMRQSEESGIDCCKHRFHWECIQAWSRIKNECPLCKRSFTKMRSMYKSESVMDPSDPNNAGKSSNGETTTSDWFSGQWYLDSLVCQSCGLGDNESVLLLCDGCDCAMHTYCLGLDSIPDSDWYCDQCLINMANETHTHNNDPSLNTITTTDNNNIRTVVESSDDSRPQRRRNSDESDGDGSDDVEDSESDSEMANSTSSDHSNSSSTRSHNHGKDEDLEFEARLEAQLSRQERCDRRYCSYQRRGKNDSHNHHHSQHYYRMNEDSEYRTPIMTRSRARKIRQQWETAALRPSALTVLAEQAVPSPIPARHSTIDQRIPTVEPPRKARRTGLGSRKTGISALF